MRGVIFDFNGTMFFDEEFQNKAWKIFIEERGKSYLDMRQSKPCSAVNE